MTTDCLAVALAAIAFALMDVEIVARERMAVLAMRLASIASGRAISTKCVLPMGYNGEMSGVDARGDTAQMVERQPFRDRTDCHLIDESMNFHHSLPDLNAAVSLLVFVPSPEPTLSSALTINLLPDSVGNRALHLAHPAAISARISGTR
jgi:hypothetical protein